MNQQPLSIGFYQHWAVFLTLALLISVGHAAGSGIEDMEPPFSSGYAPEQESEKLTNKGYRSYQQALYFGSQETPNGDAKARTALKSAEKFLRRAAKKDQKNIRAFGLLGEVLARSEQPRKAIGAFNFALQLNPKYYNAWLQRAKVLLGMGLFEDVKKSYIVLARNDAEMATELLVTIDTWAANREEALTTPETSFMEWRATQGA